MATSKRRSARNAAKASPPGNPAKFSRPRLYRVSVRERLFRLIDERREHPAVWIAGAPGAGKSALVASYLDARRASAIWYNVDQGDRDPATFFYFLGLAAAAIDGAKSAPLPLFNDGICAPLVSRVLCAAAGRRRRRLR
jgi:hypothetical protein